MAECNVRLSLSFFTYGDMPMEAHLEYIDQHVLSKFQPACPPLAATRTVRWSQPQEHRLHCSIDPTSPADEQVRPAIVLATLVVNMARH